MSIITLDSFKKNNKIIYYDRLHSIEKMIGPKCAVVQVCVVLRQAAQNSVL